MARETTEPRETESRQLMTLRSEVKHLGERKEELQEQLQEVEAELVESGAPPGTEFSPTREEWVQLAAQSKIQYRIPCEMSDWTIPAPVSQSLGLSGADSNAVMAAFRRSTQRMREGVRPLCLEILNSQAAVDLLGVSGCRKILEASATEQDPQAVLTAKKLVAEVRAGLREPLGEEEPPPMLYKAYMDLTGESERFAADLAESFGPALAQHIWENFPCVSYASG